MAFFDGTNAPTVNVDFDLGNTGIFVLGVSLLGGTDVLGVGYGINWSTITQADLRGMSIRRGRTQENQVNQPGTLTLTLDNMSGNYDPNNTSSPYTWDGYSIIMAGMGVRVRLTYGGTDYIIFRGYLETAIPSPTLDPTVTLTFTDALAWLARHSLTAISSAYSGDTTSTRVGRVLNAVGWPSGLRSLTGSRQMQPTTYGDTSLNLCELAATCEFGRFHADRQGNVVMIPYENLFTTTMQYTLSDTRVTGTIEYDDLTTPDGGLYLVNNVTLTQTSGVTQSYNNTASVTRFGVYHKDVTVPLLNNSDAIAMVALMGTRYALPKPRVNHIEFDAYGVGTLWPNVLQADLGDRITIQRTTLGTGSSTYLACIESYNWDFSADNIRISLDLSPAS